MCNNTPIYARFKGRVVSINCAEATIETKRGNIIVNIDVDFPLRINMGDQLECDNINFVIDDGVIVYMLDEKASILVNNYSTEFKERKSE